MRVALKGSISFHAYVTAVVCWLSAMKRVDPSQLRHTNSTEEEMSGYQCCIHWYTPGARPTRAEEPQSCCLPSPLAYILNATMLPRYYFNKEEGKNTQVQTHTPSLFPHLSPVLAVKGPADVSALFMQIPFCSSVTIEYCSLFLAL